MQDKKQEERRFLDLFKEHCSEFPIGGIEESEEPDFIITTSEERIGVEITKLFWNQGSRKRPLQATQSVHKLIAEKAQKIHEQSKLPSCNVKVDFLPISFRKQDADRIAREVFDLVLENFPAPNVSCRVSLSVSLEHPFPDALISVSIDRINAVHELSYTARGGGWISELDPEKDVRRILEKKNKKLEEYRKRCDKVWLVVNIGFGSLFSEFNLPSQIRDYSFESPFDRVYIVDQCRKAYWRLKLNNYPQDGEEKGTFYFLYSNLLWKRGHSIFCTPICFGSYL